MRSLSFRITAGFFGSADVRFTHDPLRSYLSSITGSPAARASAAPKTLDITTMYIVELYIRIEWRP